MLRYPLKRVMKPICIDIIDHDMVPQRGALIWYRGRIGVCQEYSLGHFAHLLLVNPSSIRNIRGLLASRYAKPPRTVRLENSLKKDLRSGSTCFLLYNAGPGMLPHKASTSQSRNGNNDHPEPR